MVSLAEAEADAVEVGEDDRAGTAPVKAVDLQGQAKVFLGGVEVAALGAKPNAVDVGLLWWDDGVRGWSWCRRICRTWPGSVC